MSPRAAKYNATQRLCGPAAACALTICEYRSDGAQLGGQRGSQIFLESLLRRWRESGARSKARLSARQVVWALFSSPAGTAPPRAIAVILSTDEAPACGGGFAMSTTATEDAMGEVEEG